MVDPRFILPIAPNLDGEITLRIHQTAAALGVHHGLDWVISDGLEVITASRTPVDAR
jgi:hypothetical protein